MRPPEEWPTRMTRSGDAAATSDAAAALEASIVATVRSAGRRRRPGRSTARAGPCRLATVSAQIREVWPDPWTSTKVGSMG